MKKYEGLFILNSAAQELGIPEAIEKVSAVIVAEGGRIETVQKMDKRSFARVANKKNQSGFYINIIFEVDSAALARINASYQLNDLVFRVIITHAPPVEAAAPTA
ncbi:MAG: ribosomal protein S6 [Candidatus Binatia bacterium]